jgi:hypothetical protein
VPTIANVPKNWVTLIRYCLESATHSNVSDAVGKVCGNISPGRGRTPIGIIGEIECYVRRRSKKRTSACRHSFGSIDSRVAHALRIYWQRPLKRSLVQRKNE